MEFVTTQAEAVLEQVPDWIWEADAAPIPIEDIADSHFGLLVRDVEEMTQAPGCPELAPGQSLSGLLLPSRGEIWVNAMEARTWPPRRRFTIAHELGHWVMHQNGQGSLFCRHGTVQEELPGITAEGDAPETGGIPRPALDPIEEEANWFAATLLMPAALVRRHHRLVDGDFDRLCTAFECSAAAMTKRLAQVGLG